MTIASLAEVKAKMSAFIDQAQTDPVIITRNGKAVAVLAPIDDDDLDMIRLVNQPKFVDVLNRSIAAYRKSGGVSAKSAFARAKRRKSSQ